MAQKQHTANRSPPTLPGEIIFYEIFPRLPSKSIHRFRCVSTLCRRLPSDQQFLSAVRHLTGRIHLLSGRRYLLSLSFHPPLDLSLYSLNLSGAASPIAVAGESQNPNIEFCNCYSKTINGLTFTFQGGHNPTVSNAATNETFQLPPFPEPTPPESRFYFCHDPETDRYKVLLMDHNHNERKCSIFTLGTDSSWRENNLQNFKQFGDSKSVCINGTLYMTRFCHYNTAVMCAFNVESEKFYAEGYPATLRRARYDECHLIELKGALAIIDIGKNSNLRKKCEIKVWIKEKGRFVFGDHWSWTELRIVMDPRWKKDLRLLKSYSFSTNCDGEIMMGVLPGLSSKDGCWIFVYNVEKGEWRRVEIQGLCDERFVYKLFVEEYSESPISLKQILNKRAN